MCKHVNVQFTCQTLEPSKVYRIQYICLYTYYLLFGTNNNMQQQSLSTLVLNSRDQYEKNGYRILRV